MLAMEYGQILLKILKKSLRPLLTFRAPRTILVAWAGSPRQKGEEMISSYEVAGIENVQAFAAELRPLITSDRNIAKIASRAMQFPSADRVIFHLESDDPDAVRTIVIKHGTKQQ